jgi:cytochrome c oxidase subunit II
MIDTEEDYAAWLGEQQTFAQLTAAQQTSRAEPADSGPPPAAAEEVRTDE